ncbi:MFS transporter [Sphingopyxis panaciterrulae]|uniref:MFS family permease n=1 Tax=Sphingopyxis panaciterrulae TaxID=462372 RepID=A0A7W9B727_9SPHN|nr:MFS transporter [Sphingopyxis panaciterrulae]MBB5707402.1 MFS family permease [Sphingopyxis panaciterrulae]
MTTKPLSDRPTRVWWLYAALVSAELVCSLESGMIYVAISGLYEQYGDPVAVGWLLTAFTLTAAASAAVAGRLGDLYGRRRVMLWMLAIAFSGSLLSATHPDLDWIIAGRAIQGVSMAILPLGFGILRENVDERHLGLGVSIIGATYTVGGGIGVIIGGVVVDNWHWQGLFHISAGLAIFAIIFVLFAVPRSEPSTDRSGLDIVGGILFAPAVAMMLFGLVEGASDGWTGSTIALIVGGLALMAGWAWYELRHPNPLIDIRLLGRRQVRLANLNILAISLGPLLGPAIYLPFLQQPAWTGIGFGITATMAAIVKIPANILASVAALGSGALTKRIPVRTLMIISAAASIAGWAGLATLSGYFWPSVIMIVLLIVPSGSVLLVLTPQLVMDAVPEERTSEATGLTQVVRAFGKAVGLQIIALGLASAQVARPDGTTFPGSSAYLIVFAVCALLSLWSLFLMMRLPRSEADKADLAAAA